MEYIFPVTEIEFQILGYLDPLIDFKQLSLVSKYYHEVVVDDKMYTALKKFCLDKPEINFKTNKLKEEEIIFILACENNHLLVAKYLLHKYNQPQNIIINIHCNDELAFILACANGHLQVAKWLYYSGKQIDSPINIHAENEHAFVQACTNNHLEVAKWLYCSGVESNSPINIHAENEYPFGAICENGLVKKDIWKLLNGYII